MKYRVIKFQGIIKYVINKSVDLKVRKSITTINNLTWNEKFPYIESLNLDLYS